MTILTDMKIVNRRVHREFRRTVFLGTRDSVGLSDGQLILTQKGPDRSHTAITEFVCAVSDATITQWKEALGLAADPSRPFAGQVVEVEDASPDSCLALLSLSLRLSSRCLPARWVDYARRWELGDVHTTGDAEESFGALQSALVHSALKAGGSDAASMDRAFRTGFAYAEKLIALDMDPAKLPRNLPAPTGEQIHELHSRAHACLTFERAIYLRLTASAQRIQLAVPLAGGDAEHRHRVLVDGLVFSEVEVTGALKVFARTDPASSSGNGYGLLALYRPGEATEGNDMTVSVDPMAHLSLLPLWRELERREEAAWEAFGATPRGHARPRDEGKIRNVRSHDLPNRPTEPSNQPWWDNNGDVTLVAAPRAVEIGGVRMPGTRLTWADVKAAVWTCFAPDFGLRVRPRGSTAASQPVTRLTRSDFLGSLDNDSGLVLADLERTDAGSNPIAVWSPTLSSAAAAAIDGTPVTLDTLPSSDGHHVIEARGGIVIVARGGVLMIMLDPVGSFPSDELKRAIGEVAATVASVGRIEALRIARDSGIRELVRKAVASGSDAYKRDALRAVYRAKLAAREAWDAAQRFETDALVRRVREACEQRWGARERLDRAIAEIEELEDMVVSSSEVRATGILNFLAVFGLPLSVFGNLLGSLLIIREGLVPGLSWPVAVGYGVSVAIGIIALMVLSWLTARRWRIDR